MLKKNLFKYICTFALLFSMVNLTIAPIFAAQSRASLSQKLRQTLDRRHYFQQKRQQADLKLRNERNKLSNNQQKLEKTQIELDNTTVKYNTLVSNLAVMEAQLTSAVREFQSMDRDMRLRINQAYKHQRPGMFELLLSATNVNSFLDILYFEKIVIKEDYKRMRIAKEKADEIASLKVQIQAQKKMVAASINDINNQKAFIQTSIDENKSMIERLKKDKSYYERSERELARQSASIQSMIASLTSRSTSRVHVSSAGFIYPISGPITSSFGWRVHPIFKSRIFHSGIDIGGPNGGAIRAANDGKVIYTGWYGGYGKVVILDHGVVNGRPITTLYAHMSAITVGNGQYVSKGQQVGREGSTGYSTGPHCHFEVRVNGKPTNPLNYL